MGKADDERIKLSATFANGIAIGMVVAGALAPLVAYSYGLPGAAGARGLVLVGVSWLVGGVALHFVARWLLRRMTP